ncbi:MAG: molybdopterin-binding protein [Pseudomonadota bacterium]
MTQPTAAMLVIGDEILSGRTQDANAHHLAGVMAEIGIRLTEIRVVEDRREAIVSAVKALSGAVDHVFTSGGIGPTHDDITADCVAEAMGATSMCARMRGLSSNVTMAVTASTKRGSEWRGSRQVRS